MQVSTTHMLVVLEFLGSLDRELWIKLEVGPDSVGLPAHRTYRPTHEISVNLAVDPRLVTALERWTQDYRRIATPTRALKPESIRYMGSVDPAESCRQSAKTLAHEFKTWTQSDAFRTLTERMLEALDSSHHIRILIRASDQRLHRLPWHLWRIFELFPLAEVALGATSLRPISSFPTIRDRQPRDVVRILAILGDCQGIDSAADQQALNALPHTDITVLVEPAREILTDQFWTQPWDILFFAGHSTSQQQTGFLRLNAEERLSLDELKYGLSKAIANGLQLAIFNSCSGIGLAHQLTDMQLPHMVVMREAVPDHVAQTFLRHCLDAFSQGMSLYLAVRNARERLQALEKRYPCASWLPMIYQNSASLPLSWQGLRGDGSDQNRQDVQDAQDLQAQELQGERERSEDLAIASTLVQPSRSTPTSRPLSQRIRQMLGASLLSTAVVMGLRWMGVLQAWELQNYDQLLRWRSPEVFDAQILVVGADETDLRTYGYPLPDDVLATLIQQLNDHQPYAIGVDIYRDHPVFSEVAISHPTGGYDALVAQFQTANVITPCTFGSVQNEAIAPPPDSPQPQWGFVDLEKDGGQLTVRRHLLSRQPPTTSLCNTDYSFPLQLLFQYLEHQPHLKMDITPTLDWAIVDEEGDRSIVLRRLESRSGGYQNLDARGNQILINYRVTQNEVVRHVSIREILENSINSDWIKDKIVLIGVVAPSIPDYHDTPMGQRRGIEIHAHAISQLLRTIEEGRSLINWLPQWGDFLYVLIWSTVGGVLIMVFKQRPQFNKRRFQIGLIIISIGIGILQLYLATSVVFSQYGLWLPIIPTSLAIFLVVILSLEFNKNHDSKS